MCKYNILSCKHASYRNVWKHKYLHLKKKKIQSQINNYTKLQIESVFVD